MGSATGRDLHVDGMLSEIAINYRPPGMIADQIAPIVSVAKESDIYPVFNRGEAFAIERTNRSRGTQANRITRSVSSANYMAKNYALAYDIPIEDRANMDAAFQFELEAGATRYLQDKLMLDWDRRSLLLAVAGVSTAFAANSSWAGGGDPINTVWLAQEYVQGITALKPNSMLVGWKAWNLLRRNQNFRNFINGNNNGGGAVTKAQAQAAFEVDRFLVANAFYNPANENKTATMSNYFPPNGVLLYYAPLAPSREAPSYMYSFRWTSPLLGTPMAAIRHEFDSRDRVDGIECQYYQDEKITGSEYGVMLTAVDSSTGAAGI